MGGRQRRWRSDVGIKSGWAGWHRGQKSRVGAIYFSLTHQGKVTQSLSILPWGALGTKNGGEQRGKRICFVSSVGVVSIRGNRMGLTGAVNMFLGGGSGTGWRCTGLRL